MRRVLVVALGVASLMAGPAVAQRAPQPTVLPLEFVESLMPVRSFTGRPGEYRPGELSPHLPRSVADGAEVIGSIVWSDQSRTALLLPADPVAARARVEAQLLAARFTHRTPVDEPRGFLPPRSAAREGGYCSPADGHATIRVLPAPSGSRVVVEITLAGDGRSCTAPPFAGAALTGGVRELLPTLRLPDGVSVDGRGSSSSGGSEASSRASASGAAAADAILRHFHPQWQQQGWTLRSEAADAGAGIQVWERRRPGGETVVGWVSVVRVSVEDLLLSMHVQFQSP